MTPRQAPDAALMSSDARSGTRGALGRSLVAQLEQLIVRGLLIGAHPGVQGGVQRLTCGVAGRRMHGALLALGCPVG